MEHRHWGGEDIPKTWEVVEATSLRSQQAPIIAPDQQASLLRPSFLP